MSVSYQYFDKLKRKIRWALFSFAILPVLLFGLTVYALFQRAYHQKITENLKTVAIDKKQAIEVFLQERVNQLITIAYSHTFDQIKDMNYLSQLFNSIQSRSKYFVDIGVIDEFGNHIAYYGPYKLLGVNYRESDWFRKSTTQAIYISDVFTGVRQVPHFIIAVVRYEKNSFWILRATIDSDIFEKLVNPVSIGKTGNAYIVNSEGILQTTPRFGQKVLDKKEGINMESIFTADLILKEIEGKDMLQVSARLDIKDWFLIIEQNPSAEIGPLFKTRNLSLLVLLAGSIFLIIGVRFVVNFIVEELIVFQREKAQLDADLIQSSKLAALGKMAAGIAHELNNPLAVILEKAGWMRDLIEEEDIKESKNFQELLKAVDKIEENVERAKKVTHRMLGFARKMEPVEETVDIAKLLNETLGFLETQIKLKGINIHTDYSPLIIKGDTSQLQQVFLNILENARDAVEIGGNIWIKTYELENDQVCVEVADDGPGIPDSEKKRIFEPFYTTKEVGSGTGLGLSISYSIIKKMGGDITVHDNKPKGALFKIRIPKRRAEI
jgi:two-component system NtrC family sensor kinase